MTPLVGGEKLLSGIIGLFASAMICVAVVSVGDSSNGYADMLINQWLTLVRGIKEALFASRLSRSNGGAFASRATFVKSSQELATTIPDFNHGGMRYGSHQAGWGLSSGSAQ